MAQKERTAEGVERYYQTRERAMAQVLKELGNPGGAFGKHELKISEADLVTLLANFALNERKREQADLPVQPPTKAEQEAAADRVFGVTQEQTKSPSDTDRQCFEKARAKGEPTFTLRAQDESAARIVREWVTRNWWNCSPEKLVDALRIAQAMDKWPSKKRAD